MTEDRVSFSAEEAVKVQRELRRSLGLDAERFPLEQFVGMISDEVEQFRAAGRSDTDVAQVIQDAVGREVDPAAITAHYAGPELRHHTR